MDPLATLADLTARTGTVPDPVRGLALLKDASAAVRAFTRQTISLATSAVRLVPSYGRLRLPQWPVVAVTGAVDDLGDDVDLVWPSSSSTLTVYSDQPLTVSYTHGYAVIPDDVIAVVCQIAGRALGITSDASALQSESLGAYSYSVQAAAAAGPIGMLPDERALLKRFRRPTPAIAMLS